MGTCVVCNKILTEGLRIKDLTESKLSEDDPNITLMDLVSDLIPPTLSGKGKAKKKKSVDMQRFSCLPCYRELTSLAELQAQLLEKQFQLLRKIEVSRLQEPQNNKRKKVAVTQIKPAPNVLRITREVFIPPPPPPPPSPPKENNDEMISLRSIVSMDAEITITEEENGGTAINVEVVEGTSDLKRPNGLFGCRFCKKEFIKPNFCFNHMQEMHGKILHTCQVCGDEFRLKSELDDHRATHLTEDPLPFQCGSCPRAFDCFENFQDHSKEHELKRRFGCGQCGRKYDSEHKLNQHMLTHKNRPYSCLRCTKNFSSQHAFMTHQKFHCGTENSSGVSGQRFHCNLCTKHFSSAENLHAHLKNHNKPYKCTSCSRGFDTESALAKHTQVHLAKKLGLAKRDITCEICGKLFVSLQQLECHKRIHTGERPFQCDSCGATFTQRSNLDSHQKAVHLQERRFKCGDCDKSFKRRRLLQYHIRSIHTGERPYSCQMCNASFVYPEHFKKHVMSHSGLKPYACEICGKTFSSKDNRNSHRFTHSNRKPYECQVCGHSFMRKPALLQHLIDQGHGDPETAGAAVKIVQVLTGHEMEPNETDHHQDHIEWGTLEIHHQQETGEEELDMSSTEQDCGTMQTIIIPDAMGRPIEIKVISNDHPSISQDDQQQEEEQQPPSAADQLQFELSAESLNVIQAFELQGGNVDDTLAALM